MYYNTRPKRVPKGVTISPFNKILTPSILIFSSINNKINMLIILTMQETHVTHNMKGGIKKI